MSEEWNGEGWPSAGDICEAYFENHECICDGWQRVEVLKVYPHTDRPFAVLEDGILAWAFKVRPIKTKEDIEREEAISDMAYHFNRATGDFQHAGFRAMFDAGYRNYGDVVSAEQFQREYMLSPYEHLMDFAEDFIITRKVK